MRAFIINNHIKHFEELRALFPDSDVMEKENLREGLDISLYDLLIISGGSGVSPVASYPQGYNTEFRLIKEASIPVLGICLGSEIITYAFGGTLLDLHHVHRGTIQLDILDKRLSEILNNQHVSVHESHRIITKELPPDFVVCATSEHGVEIMKHANKPIIGIQFHPEISKNEDLFKWIFETLHLS